MDRPFSSYNLAPGYHLVPESKDRWLLYTSDDQWVQLNTDPEKIAHLRPILYQSYSSGEMQQQAVDAAKVRPQYEEFLAYGLLRPAQPEPLVKAPALHTHIVCHAAPADILHTLLQPVAAYTLYRHSDLKAALAAIDKNQGAEPQCLIHCAAWLPDQDWQQLDRHCRDVRLP